MHEWGVRSLSKWTSQFCVGLQNQPKSPLVPCQNESLISYFLSLILRHPHMFSRWVLHQKTPQLGSMDTSKLFMSSFHGSCSNFQGLALVVQELQKTRCEKLLNTNLQLGSTFFLDRYFCRHLGNLFLVA